MTPSQLGKQRNLDAVRTLLRERRTATCAELARLSGLSVVTMGALIRELVAGGEAVPDGRLPSEGGRPSQVYRFNAGHAHALALCVLQKHGETLLLASVADLQGTVLSQSQTRLHGDEAELLMVFARDACQKDGLIRSIGVGIPGQAAGGTVRFCDVASFTGLSLCERLAEQTGCVVTLENDMNAAVYGYACRGGPKEDECTVGVYFPPDNGPGAGVLTGRALLGGKGGMAGELGNLPLSVDWLHQREPFEPVISDCLQAVAAVLSPHRVILYREGLNLAALEACMQERWPPVLLKPELVTDEALLPDYERGVRQLALEKLWPAPQERTNPS